jgi:F-type H+-transporting ATPase subunit b
MDNMIELNATLFIQLANFLITLVVLNYLLIRPIRQQIAARNALTSGYAVDIEEFSSKASEKLSEYEIALGKARAQAGQAREAIKLQGAANEQKILHAAQAEAHAYLQASRAETAKEVQTAMKTLLSQVDSLAAKAASRILG